MTEARDAALERAVADLEQLVKSTREARERAEDAARRIPIIEAGIAAVERDIDARTSVAVEGVRARIEALTAEGAELIADMDKIAVRYKTSQKKMSWKQAAGVGATERLEAALAAYRALDRTPMSEVVR